MAQRGPGVNFFMNKFQKLGFIQYDGEIHVNNSQLSVVLHDQFNFRAAKCGSDSIIALYQRAPFIGMCPSAMNGRPVVHCAYGYQKENQEEAHKVEESCGQEGGADEEVA